MEVDTGLEGDTRGEVEALADVNIFANKNEVDCFLITFYYTILVNDIGTDMGESICWISACCHAKSSSTLVVSNRIFHTPKRHLVHSLHFTRSSSRPSLDKLF